MNTGSWLRRALRALHRREKGQTLVLAAFSMVVVLGIGALVIDIGRFMHGQQDVENAVDAAALAAAQELPNNGTAALNNANKYLSDNDTELSNKSITFRCIVGDRDHNGQRDATDVPAVCNPGSHTFTCSSSSWTCVAQCDPSQGNKCNTVVVGASKDVPFALAPVLNIFHDSTGNIRAAACRGACGGPPTIPLDLVIIIDRTRSMSTTDLNYAKAAANSVLTMFDPSRQHVALGVLPQSTAMHGCQSVSNTYMEQPDVGYWVPVELSSNYQSPGNTLVSTINCLAQAADPYSNPETVCLHYDSHGHCTQSHTTYPGCRQTNIGEAVKRAADYLQASGRDEVKKGIILLTDGVANRPSSTPSCLYGYNQATAAKGNDIEVFTIGYGLGGAQCEPPDTQSDCPSTGWESSGPYVNQRVTTLLADMATESADDHNHCSSTSDQTAENGDGDHFMCKAKNAELATLFQQAAASLASGARLIQVPPD